MVEGRIAEQCAPTLAGIKCGSLFRTHSDIAGFASEIELINAELGPRGVTVATFRPSGRGTLVYVYRKDLLSRISSDRRSVDMLEDLGYDTSSTGSLVRCLKERTEEKGCVPHEIGIFLGYPYEDVKGFVDGGECKCMGCWKVYGSIETAERMFRRFRKCRDVYARRYRQGTTLAKLTVTS